MAVSNEPPNILLNSVGIGKCSLQNPLKKILCWSVENESWPGASEGLVFAYNKKDQVGIIKKQQHDTLIKGRHSGNKSEDIFCWVIKKTL